MQEIIYGVRPVVEALKSRRRRVFERVAGRETARREKDWATADRLRDELGADGWAVEDTPEGPILSPR